MPTPQAYEIDVADDKRPSRANRAVVIAILAVAAFLRIAALDRYPLPIHQDELTDIYDGYSLATTGADRSGARWPVLMRGIGPGDYHPPAYAYIAAIPGYIVGFSVRAGRLPAALAGILTVWLVYLTALRLTDYRAALLALLFVALSPIHILYSRQAHEGVYLVPLCVIAVVYLLVCVTIRLRTREQRSALPLALSAGLVAGLSTNVYPGQRLTALLFAMAAALGIGWTVGVRQRRIRRCFALIGVLAISAAIGASPQIYALVNQPDQFFARANATVPSLRCGVQWWAEHIAMNLALNLDPHYLFLSFGEPSLLSVTRLNVAWLPFLYVGLLASCVIAFRQRNLALAWVPLGVLFSLAPALITDGSPSSMRSSGVWALYPIVCAIGVALLARCASTLLHGLGVPAASGTNVPVTVGPPQQDDLRSRLGFAPGMLATTAVALLVVGAGAFDVGRYLSRPDLQAAGSQHQFVRIGEWLRDNGSPFERVYVDAPGMFGYLYVASFSGMTPEEFVHSPRKGSVKGLGWDEYQRFGRFHFATLAEAQRDWDNAAPKGAWLVIDGNLNTVVLKPEDTPVAQAARPQISVP